MKKFDFPTGERREHWVRERNKKLEEMGQYFQRYFHLTKVRENESSYEVQGYVYHPGYGEIRMAFEFTYDNVAKFTDLFENVESE
ncbi:hypothetical protein [Halobacillus naozhouensis]|uniref:Uncharacterized protein n=1 Tax=Halobacillus naozhouensis TaxID=554880 RepID=A0ABY8J260_9BACI|nr:hypothetical protein [Halobacillus naozhouensis]WFT75056.1 hypothetical protein P9989_01220 [Halobacillus naozhouensis]